MNQDLIIEKTIAYVRENLGWEGTGHDWWHVYRVWQNAIHIAKEEKADLFLVQIAALLHDIADWKFHHGDDTAGPKLAREWLEKVGVDEKIIAHVCEIIQGISFKGAGVKIQIKTKEGMVVQDADRLDAIGAIGIARAFTYGGHKGREIYNPYIRPHHHESFEEYKNSKGPTINHFYEKLLLLKDLMNTKTARKMAEERHAFMELFLERFFKEWNENEGIVDEEI
ncbi:MAG: HD domain-containing protein [Nitrospirae bacterium]|nr:HD domain-containing protein [Nitrospirota bacterium]